METMYTDVRGGGRVKKSLEMHEETQTPEKCHLLHSSKKFRFNKCLCSKPVPQYSLSGRV